MLYLYVSIFQFSGHDVRLTVKFFDLRHSYQEILYLQSNWNWSTTY